MNEGWILNKVVTWVGGRTSEGQRRAAVRIMGRTLCAEFMLESCGLLAWQSIQPMREEVLTRAVWIFHLVSKIYVSSSYCHI